MKTLSDIEFPETPEEAEGWSHIVRRLPLHMKVLCVAHTRIEGTWRAYCAPVPGERHEDEMQFVFDWGEAIPERIALAMFPDFKGIPYAR